jgi:hypothetical protein
LAWFIPSALEFAKRCASIAVTACNARYSDFTETLTIRNLDDKVKRKLQVRAALNGRSMEAEARQILTHSVSSFEGIPTP